MKNEGLSKKINGIALGLILLFGMTSSVMINFTAYGQLTEDDSEMAPSILDIAPPVFNPKATIIMEATNSNGAIVDYELPTAQDDIQVKSVTCTPGPKTLFSLGDTDVTCTATDTSDNASQTTFQISVIDSTAPVISELSNTEIVVYDLFSEIELETPQVLDSVDSFPLITNDAPNYFPLGETIITWNAKDFSDNESSKSQIVILTLDPPEIIGPTEITQEATAISTPVDKIEFDIITKSNLDFLLESDTPESFSLGNHTVTWTLTDIVDNVVTHVQNIVIEDTTPPSIDATIYTQSLSKNQDKGTFRIFYDVRDLVDYNPTITAELNGLSVYNGQFVTLEYNEKNDDIKQKQGVSYLRGTSFILTVTATDASQNFATVSSNAVFLMPPKDEELEIEELKIEDLIALLERLETIPPTDLTNLGQELQQLKFVADLLFDQEKAKIKELKDEFKEQIKLASNEEKKQIQREYKNLIKDSRDEFKSLQTQYKDIFHQYKSVTKLMLEEKKELKSNELEKEIEKISNRLTRNEESRQTELDNEKSDEQSDQDARTNIIFEKILDKIGEIENNQIKKQNFEALHAIKSEVITSKDKQKLIQVILKTSDKSLKAEFKQIIKDVKKNQKELKKTLKLQEKELRELENEIKKAEKEQKKLTKLEEKQLEKIEKELKKLEKEQKKQLEKEQKSAAKDAKKVQKELQKQLEKDAKDAQKDLKKEAKKAEKEAKKEAKKAEKEAKKAEKEAKKAEKESKKG